MVGFTTISERSGEEAAYTLMRSRSKLMGEAIREHCGAAQSFTGDGIGERKTPFYGCVEEPAACSQAGFCGVVAYSSIDDAGFEVPIF